MSRRPQAASLQASAPVFPGPLRRTWSHVNGTGQLDLSRIQRLQLAEKRSAKLIIGVPAQINRAGDKFAQARADDGGAVALHQHHRIAAKRARERAALLRFDHEKIGVAELVVLIPERNFFSDCRAEMKHRHDPLAGYAEWHYRRGMMMAYRRHIAARLVNFAVNDALRIKPRIRRFHRLGIKREFENVARLDQQRRPRTRH